MLRFSVRTVHVVETPFDAFEIEAANEEEAREKAEDMPSGRRLTNQQTDHYRIDVREVRE